MLVNAGNGSGENDLICSTTCIVAYLYTEGNKKLAGGVQEAIFFANCSHLTGSIFSIKMQNMFFSPIFRVGVV